MNERASSIKAPEQGAEFRPTIPLSSLKALSFSYQVGLAAVLGWLVWAIDDWTGLSLQYADYFIIAGTSLVLMLLPVVALRVYALCWIPSLWCLYLVWLPLVDTNGLKPLLRGTHALAADMDRAQILSTIHEHYSGSPFEPPVILREDEEQILLRPRPQPGNSEVMHILLSDGHFESSWFSAD